MNYSPIEAMRRYLGNRAYPPHVVKLAADLSDDAAHVLVDWLEEQGYIPRGGEHRLRPGHEASDHELDSWRLYVDLVRGAILGRAVERPKKAPFNTRVIENGSMVFCNAEIAMFTETTGLLSSSSHVRFVVGCARTVHENMYRDGLTTTPPVDYSDRSPVDLVVRIADGKNDKTWRLRDAVWRWERVYDDKGDAWNVEIEGRTDALVPRR